MTATQELNAVCFAACPSEQVQALLHPLSAKIGAGFTAFNLPSLEITVFLSHILVGWWWNERSCLGCYKGGWSQKASEDKLDQSICTRDLFLCI